MIRILSPFSLTLLLAGCVLLSSCDLLGQDDSDSGSLETTGVFVAVGGNFTQQNGMITVYDPESNQTSSPPELNLNAFIQSITLQNDKLFAQLNTGFAAGRVNVINADTYNAVAQTDSIGATRYAALPSPDSSAAYVSTLSGTVHRFDVQSGDVSENPAQVGATASDLLATQDKVFTTIPDDNPRDTVINSGSTLAVYNTGAPGSVRTIELGCDGPSSIAQDEEDELVVVCTGQTTYNSDFSSVVSRTNGRVVFVDPNAETVNKRLTVNMQLGSMAGTQIAQYDGNSEFLHAASSSTETIVRVDTEANALNETIEVPADSSLMGIASLAYDGTTQRLYVGRGDVQKPFEAGGTVVVLDASGTETTRFAVDRSAPSHIALRRESP